MCGETMNANGNNKTATDLFSGARSRYDFCRSVMYLLLLCVFDKIKGEPISKTYNDSER